MRNTKWLYKTYEKLDNNINFDKDILSILSSRGINGKNQVDKFLNSQLMDLPNPYDYIDVEKAVNKILECKNNSKSIWIYGDYDVDGITSTSLLYLAFKEIGLNPNFYIPLRDEGYGLNKEAISYIKEQGADLIITVDCGISSHTEINHSNNLGLDIIITDHHEINNGIPNAYATINPKREDNKDSFNLLAGVGTAFMVILALFEKLNIKNNAYKYLDIVALGTVADIVPLIGYNRIIVKHGLELLKSSKWTGLNMLLKRIYENPMEKKFDTYDVGFIIAPIFNAAGRLEDAKMGVTLLTSEDHVVCDQLIYNMINKNSERKDIQEKILQRAIDIIEKNSLDKNNIIVVAEEGFHHGVIGIVASKIVDKYYKPCVIMEIKPKEGIATASCRSIEGFNMIEMLNTFPELFLKYGGHAGAAGFSIPIENISQFSERINLQAEAVMDATDFIKPIKIDREISFYKISYDLLEKLSLLEPYGFGNPSPLFAVTNCHYSNLRKIGKEENHLMLNLIKDGLEIKNCVWFNGEDMFDTIVNNKEIDVAFKLKLESYKDKYQYKIFIEDVKPSQEKINYREEMMNLYDLTFPIEAVFYTRKDLSESKLNLNFTNNEITIYSGMNLVGYLDPQIQYILKTLKEKFNYNFSIEIKNVIPKPENYNIHILIKKDFSFSSLAIKPGELFKDIKNHLIGDFNYNKIQKEILGSIFKEKLNTLGILNKGRGINTIIKTIGLYFKSLNKKVLLITDENSSDLNNYLTISSNYLPEFDFYIYLNIIPENIPKNNNILVLSTKDISIDNFNTIKDNFNIPTNIEFIEDEKELISKEYFYSKKLPISDRVNIQNKLNTFKILYSSKDILIIL